LLKTALSRSKINVIARSISAGWTILLVVLMSLGTFSSVRIGAMTWGPQQDVWSAAIAISEIKFGLSGGLAYKEVEQAIADEVTSKKNIWDVLDNKTRALTNDPSAVTRGFQKAAALTKNQITIPTTKEGYVTDWCEDLGYADFYNLAFQLFGFNAYSTYFLYVTILLVSVLVFQAIFFRDGLAMITLMLSTTALFLSTCSFFSELVPSLAANRFLSTLAFAPLLHLVCSAIRVGPLKLSEAVAVVLQATILAFAMDARSSGNWCILALVISLLAVACLRLRHIPRNLLATKGFNRRPIFTRWPFGRLVATGVLAVVVVAAFGLMHWAQLDERYFWEDNQPGHLVWHSAYLGLASNPEWPKYKPFPDIPDGGDGVGFRVFEHRMQERGEQASSLTHEIYAPYYYRARVYEKVIRREYLSFLFAHPSYALELFFHYKPMALIRVLGGLISSIPLGAGLLALGSLVLGLLVLWSSSTRPARFAELSASVLLIWLSSLLPVFWAYPAPHVISDPAWATMLVLLIAPSFAIVLLARGPRSNRPGGREGRDRTRAASRAEEAATRERGDHPTRSLLGPPPRVCQTMPAHGRDCGCAPGAPVSQNRE
jgi:hypothetical protein